jgi:arsenite-transporting ATPase
MEEKDIREIAERRKFLFFGGKGGVGKTTMAAATAVWLADNGYDTLVVATDPTVSLSATFGQKIDELVETRIEGFDGLHGLNIDPKKAPGLFQQRLEGMTQGMEKSMGKDLLSTPCMEEMAAFDQFVSYLQDESYDRVVFDTAPTGHTLRELSMPFDWANYMADSIQMRGDLSGMLGLTDDESAMDTLKLEKARYDGAVRSLSDPKASAFNLVLLPEKLPVEETARAIKDLGAFGISVPAVIVNEVIPMDALRGNTFLERRRANQEVYLDEIGARFQGRHIREVPLLDSDVHGADRLRQIGGFLYGGSS